MKPRFFTKPMSLVAIAVLGVCIVYTPGTLPRVPLCWFARLTGLPCPGCGITRSLAAIAHGRFADAWQFNPFGYPVFLALTAVALGPLLVRIWPGFERWLTDKKAFTFLPALFAVAIFIFGAWRIYRVVEGG